MSAPSPLWAWALPALVLLGWLAFDPHLPAPARSFAAVEAAVGRAHARADQRPLVLILGDSRAYCALRLPDTDAARACRAQGIEPCPRLELIATPRLDLAALAPSADLLAGLHPAAVWVQADLLLPSPGDPWMGALDVPIYSYRFSDLTRGPALLSRLEKVMARPVSPDSPADRRALTALRAALGDVPLTLFDLPRSATWLRLAGDPWLARRQRVLANLLTHEGLTHVTLGPPMMRDEHFPDYVHLDPHGSELVWHSEPFRRLLEAR